MKRTGLPFSYLMFVTLFLSVNLTTHAFAHSNGAPAGYTGSPGDGHNCTSCHGGSAVPVSGWITSNIPAQGYTAGSSYTITVTVSGTGNKGFEVSPQNAAGTQLGVLAAGTGSHLTGGTKYVTHNSPGSYSGTAIWNFTWTAPAAGTGTVTLYGACVVGQPNIKLTTLVVSEYVATPLSATASATPSLICAGQTSQLNVIPAGGSGSYTYSWTSVPAGFTSTLQNPVVSPAEATQYNVHVSDGAQSADASANVDVNQPATAMAGNDTTCAFITTQVQLNGSATNYSAVLWTTSGTGTFSAAASLTGLYYPSLADKTSPDITLTLTASAQSPCPDPASSVRHIHFDGPTGIAGLQNDPGLAIFPNPSPGMFAIRITGSGVKEASVIITSMQGKDILQHAWIASSARSEQIDMTGYPKGIYLVKIRRGQETSVRKLVIE